ncbi:hypothetical protein G7Y89_g9742 [Cudoniella acicularis]|uniref:FAD-binding PCMH-type domain-containing protein n=1 Tax=Cudoniella acicularis TaxID=354080 RepID=A0A8H4RGB7_9HELO|nr:hypothetical protein G7Y89_g9742 [Cudoniella acicularis]
MHSLFYFVHILSVVSWVPSILAESICDGACQLGTILKPLLPLLSPNASIVYSSSAAPRWSEFDEPTPGAVVNVATEHDVLVTAGGNAWADTFNLGQKDITINLRALNRIEFNQNRTRVTIQGGTIIQELINSAYLNDARVPTGNSNCVGVLGSTLGGGVGRLMGLYGLGIDNLMSLNIVTAQGIALQVDAQKFPDLWWALRGAGANFAIVTSATMKSYPVAKPENGAWTGSLVFAEDKIEALVDSINRLDLQPEMAIFLYYASTGPPNNNPIVLVNPYYIGTTEDGKSAFSTIYSIGPVAEMTAWTPYNETNDGSNPFCVKGGRKPVHSAGLARLHAPTWRAIWNEYVSFLETPGVGNSIILVEGYSMYAARRFSDSSSAYPFRETVNFHAAAMPWYYNSSIDAQALAFGSRVRDLWRSTDGLEQNSTYINFAFDDSPSTVYGENLPKLRELKRIYDSLGQFDQFFPLS